MIYQFLRVLIKIALKIFFKKIHVRNTHHVPEDVPLIIVANHPSTAMDPIVLGNCISQPLHFLVRGNIFTTNLRKWILDKLNMIPIYRKHENPELVEKNEEIFQKCYQILSQKNALLIFPEGMSNKERRLHPIKTGAARIALGAEASNRFSLGLVILPVGLNYSEVGIFRGELFINFDNPIHISRFFDKYKKDARDGVNALTDFIRERLLKLSISVEDKSLDDLTCNIEMIYERKLSKEFGLSTGSKEDEFLLTKGIVDAVYYFNRNNPERVESLRRIINKYFNNLKRFNLRDHFFQKTTHNRSFTVDSFKMLLFIITGFPLYIYGLINNYLPYKIPAVITNRMSVSVEYHGHMKMIFGMITFLIFYPLQIFVIYDLFSSYLITLLYTLLLPISGFFTYYYYIQLGKIRNKMLFISLFYRRSFLISQLIQQRLVIMKELETTKLDYLKLQQEISNVS